MTICFNSNKAVHWSLQFVFKKDPTIFEVGAVTSCTCFGTRNHWKNQLRTWRNDLKLLLLTPCNINKQRISDRVGCSIEVACCSYPYTFVKLLIEL